jgi:GTP-binding protein Era
MNPKWGKHPLLEIADTGTIAAMDEPMIDHEGISSKAGFVAVAGRPNVGKSTLINRLLGQKIAAVTHRPQTTRRQQLGILTSETTQIIFVDTPGIHLAQHKLGEKLNDEAVDALSDADMILVVVDGSVPPQDEDNLLALTIREVAPSHQKVLVLNKIDLLKTDSIQQREESYQELFPTAFLLQTSARTGAGLPELIVALQARLPENVFFFPPDQVTDSFERDIAADLIREAALIHLRDEVPNSIAVRVDEYTERKAKGAYIEATLFVERDSQKGIVIGKDGKKLKLIGMHARKEIEDMSGRKVFLRLRVKLRKNWRNDDNSLALFGFRGPK